MPNARDIRRRIKSVKNIQQITKAMEMVAAARLRRAQERAVACRPYVEKIRDVLKDVAIHSQNRNHPLLRQRGEDKILYLVVSADKGLAGAYTSNLLREAVSHISASGPATLVVSGRKGRDYFKRRNYSIAKDFIGISERPRFDDAAQIAQVLFEGYAKGEYNQVYVVYTHFYSPMNQKPLTTKLLPVDIEGVTFGTAEDDEKDDDEEDGLFAELGYGDENGDSYDTYIVEPSPEDVLNRIMPRYLEAVVYEALLQSAASELGARMTAMGSATTNAQDIISELTLNYNKVRQSAITREISEIVGGVEALQ